MTRNYAYLCLLGSLLGCSARHHTAAPDAEQQNATSLAPSATPADRVAELQRELRANDGLSGQQLHDKHPLPEAPALGYEPQHADGLSRIQASTHALSAPELERLSKLGFVVSAANEFPTMLYGYASLYVQDLPLYVSADSILDSLARSYDAMLEDVETSVLADDLGMLVGELRDALSESGAGASVKRDVDLYLAVAQGLLQEEDAPAVAGADRAEVAELTALARQASAHERRVLFGSERDIDFSQLKPRGHYTHSAALGHYFQALAWLSRGDLRLIETLPDGDRVLRAPQLEAAGLLRELLQPGALERYRRIAEVLAAFAGHSDAMGITELDELQVELHLGSWRDLSKLDSELVTQTILDKGYGTQQIAGQLLKNHASDGRSLPVSRAFALLGQHYTADSYVLSNVVYDVVPDRLMPNPLDAAYAAFGNDAALGLLGSELDRYAGALESTRRLVDLHEPAYWAESLYSRWLHALRSLSPSSSADAGTLPEFARSRAWQARVVNTQLASWAQLRHSMGLYAKPSYTVGVLCEYPDAYVEPYPAFFAALQSIARRGKEVATLVAQRDEALGNKLSGYFENLESAAARLGAMASAELAHRPFDASDLAFINDAVRKTDDCPGPALFDGWYAKLDYSAMEHGRVESRADPVVADVHTQPTDLGGRDVGRILHIGVGLPRLMVLTAQTCQGPRAYAGLVSSYREQITEHWQRLDDGQWTARILGASDEAIPDPEWSRTFVVEAAP